MAAPRQFLSFETISLIIAFAILATAGVVTIQTEAHRRESGAWVRHTLQVEGALFRLDGAIRRAESEERGYLITKDPSYFNAGEALWGRARKEFSELEALVGDNPTQKDRLAKLRPKLDERLGLLQQKLDLMRTGRFDEAASLVRDGRGKALSDEIDALVGEMIADEEDLYHLRGLNLAHATESLQTAIGVTIVLLAGVGLFAVFMAQRQISALHKSGEALRHAYNELIEESTRRAALEAQLRQSQKLEALGQLAGGIAHDFNNMLGVIVASLNILRRKLNKKDYDVDGLISSGMDGAERAAELVRRLLAFSRIQPLNPTSLDANRLIGGMSEILHRTLGSGIELVTRLGPDLWPIRADQNELENVILNLAVNARDAMPGGGRLTIETVNRALDDAASEKSGIEPGDYVLIAVSDTGKGMEPEVLAKAFDPFFTTKPVGKGTGLGLSQAHGFVRQSGGDIRIDSLVGAGTTVQLFLPRFQGDDAARPAPKPSRPPPDDYPHGRPGEIILLVDDDDTSRRITAQGVRELGYTVLEAASGKEAIQIIRAQADISLLVTDVVMPEMNGARLAREAVFRRHALHVLFVTGYASHAIRNGILDPDVNLLTKPFTLAQLAGKIRDTLDGRADLSRGQPSG
jgi:signal transduction histidine kinase